MDPVGFTIEIRLYVILCCAGYWLNSPVKLGPSLRMSCVLNVTYLFRARPSILSDIKDKMLRLLLAQSHGLLVSSGCPLDEVRGKAYLAFVKKEHRILILFSLLFFFLESFLRIPFSIVILSLSSSFLTYISLLICICSFLSSSFFLSSLLLPF